MRWTLLINDQDTLMVSFEGMGHQAFASAELFIFLHFTSDYTRLLWMSCATHFAAKIAPSNINGGTSRADVSASFARALIPH